MKTITLLVALFFIATTGKTQSANNLPKLKLEKFASGFNAPIDIANCGDSRLFIVERLGKIWVVDADGNKSAEPFLDITDKVFTVFPNDYDERGLLGLAFHPNYPDSPYLYVNYIGFDSNSHIARFTTNPNNPNKAMKHSQFMLLTVGQPHGAQFVNHKAGCLKFGPDGYLYGTLGDGGYFGDPLRNGQNPRVLLGKMFRIDVNHPDPVRGKNYSIPPSNPFVNKDKFKDEIWALGLRNPFRFSFDRKNGALWLPDVGQDKWEEINVELPGSKGGRNYGWNCYEGYHNYAYQTCDFDKNNIPPTFPIIEYKHNLNNGCTSITGGFVYRGSKYKKMYGKYFYCDYCTGKFSTVINSNDSWQNIFLTQSDEFSFVGFGEDHNGELYVANNVSGEIFHLTDASASGDMVSEDNNDLIKQLNVKLYPNPNHGQFTVELNVTQKGSYKIYVTNVYGREIIAETKQAATGINRWSFSGGKMQQGIYMLHIQTAKGVVTQKFVVE